MSRARWTVAWVDVDDTVAVEFWHSPDVIPDEVVVEEQAGSIALMLTVKARPQDVPPNGMTWQRQSLERHVAGAKLPFQHGERPIRDAKPRPTGIAVPASHLLDPDDTRSTYVQSESATAHLSEMAKHGRRQ